MAKLPPSTSSEDKTSVEYNAFIQFYAKLTTVFCDRNYLSHFVPAGIISPNDVHDMSNLSDNDRAMRLLKNILAPLECGENQSFYKMLEIMQTYGNLHAKQLAGNITLSVRGINPVVQNQITMTIEAAPASTSSSNVATTTSSSSTIDFSDCDDIPSAFSLLTAEISKLLKRADFFTLRRAILQQRKVPKGVQFPDDLYQSIKTAQDLDTLLDLLADSKYWSWVDLRLLETLIMSSGIREAKVLLNKYKEIIFSKKLSEVLDILFMPQQKKDKDAYTTRVGSKLEKDPNEITVADLARFSTTLEKVIMDINNGSCVLEHLGTGCLEIHWLIPIQCRFHAYKSALNNRHRFSEIHLQYLHIEPYPPIYDPFTIQPTILSTLLRLPKPFASTPAEVIDHYYYFLTESLDNNTICQTMLKLELMTKRDLVDSTKMYSEYQRNSFLLDQLLTSDASNIIEFCYELQNTENRQEIGKMLVNAIESMPADDEVDKQLSATSSQPTSSEEDDTSVSLAYQPEVFLAAKVVRMNFFNLIIQLKPRLRECDPQCFLEALNKLTANAKTATHHKTIPLFPSTYLEDLKNNSSEEIFSRLSFLWTWNDHSILRALLEACNCQDGIKMLDEFESQIDTSQPMELFPIPPPSVKMAPPLSSAYTVLSIRCEYGQIELTSLQYVSDVAKIMIEKFNFSQHSLQLLATRASPLMLYWMIPKCVVPLVNKGVKEHLDFLKDKGFSEMAIYPNIILFAADNLTCGSFALLSSTPRDWQYVEKLQLDSQPANARVKELETIVDELQSELEVRSKDMDTLRNEKRAILDKYVQVKRKYDQREDDSATLSKPVELDSIEHEVHEQNNILKTEIGQLKSSKRQLSNEFERLKEKYQILAQEFEKSTFINEAEVIMGQLEETLAEVESNLNNLPFVKPHKKAATNKESPVLPDFLDDISLDVAKRPSGFLSRMLTFKTRLEEVKDQCHIENLQLDLQPANVRVKELETIVDELQSELQVKSKHMETLKNEKKSVMDKYLQLKRKQNFKEDDSVVLSQPTVLDSLEDEPENISNYFQEAIAGTCQITCTPCANLPSPMYYAHATSDDASVYISGGVSPDKDTVQQVYQYVLKENKWNVLPVPQQYYGIPQVVNGILMLFGGRDVTSGKVTNRVSTFHSDDGQWHSDFPDMLVPRTRPAVVTHLNDVIVAGGKGEDTTVVLDDIEVLNITKRQWQKLPIHLPKPMWGISATASKQYFHIVGYNGADNHCYNDAYTIALEHVSYKSASAASADQGLVKTQNLWVSLPDAPLWYSALVPTSSPPVILGGEDKNGEVVAVVTIYEQANQLWRQVDPVKLPWALAYATVAQAGKNAIIVIGGCTNTKTTNDASSASLSTVTKMEFKPVS